ncbi:hypothetical protein VE03_00048 [Pseudogymnoascus sp. 23342-1-I1]|nr:hypothetical protein VE03_00048 [Pseudogymnoascus sp. 23342-1-I1]
MPFVGLVVIEVLVLVGLSSEIGGTVSNWCSAHPGPFCGTRRTSRTIDMGKRDVIDMGDVPKLNVERQAVGPCNIPKYNFDLCRDQVKSQTARVVSSIPVAGEARFDNIPPACMNLAAVLGGSCTGTGARPTPCGSACMKYTSLTDEQMSYLSRALNA